jgi:Xaa-Pro dipeptidase
VSTQSTFLLLFAFFFFPCAYTAGCYFSPHLLAPWRDSPYIDPAVLARYEPVGGVRLEDVVVVEEKGVRNLTWVVREREEVEGLCSGKA